MINGNITSTSTRITESLIDNSEPNLVKKTSSCFTKLVNNVIFQLLMLWIFMSGYGISMLYLEFKLKSNTNKDLYKLFSIPVGFSTLLVSIYILIKIFVCCCQRKKKKPVPSFNSFGVTQT